MLSCSTERKAGDAAGDGDLCFLRNKGMESGMDTMIVQGGRKRRRGGEEKRGEERRGVMKHQQQHNTTQVTTAATIDSNASEP